MPYPMLEPMQAHPVAGMVIMACVGLVALAVVAWGVRAKYPPTPTFLHEEGPAVLLGLVLLDLVLGVAFLFGDPLSWAARSMGWG